MTKNLVIVGLIITNISTVIFINNRLDKIDRQSIFDIDLGRKQYNEVMRDFYLKGCSTGIDVGQNIQLVKPGEWGYNNPVQLCVSRYDLDEKEYVEQITPMLGKRDCNYERFGK